MRKNLVHDMHFALDAVVNVMHYHSIETRDGAPKMTKTLNQAAAETLAAIEAYLAQFA